MTFSDHDRAQLAASTIPVALAEALGWRTETDPARVTHDLGLESSYAASPDPSWAPALAIPYADDYVRYKRLHPRTRKDGSAAKYESPLGRPSRVYIPLAAGLDPAPSSASIDERAALRARRAEAGAEAGEVQTYHSLRPLWITEGEKKAVAWTYHTGHPTVALSGVWNWSDVDVEAGPKRERSLHPDLRAVLSDGREIVLAFDGDLWSNDKVADAGARLYLALRAAGHRVSVAVWDPALGKGLDDLLADGHADAVSLRPGDPAEWASDCATDLDELRRLAVWLAAIERQKQRKDDVTLPDDATLGRLGREHSLDAKGVKLLARIEPATSEPARPGRPWTTEGTGYEREHVLSDGSRLPGGTVAVLGSSAENLARAYVGAHDTILALRDGHLVAYTPASGRWIVARASDLDEWLSRQQGTEAADGRTIDLSPTADVDVRRCMYRYLRGASERFWTGRDAHWLTFSDVSIRYVDLRHGHIAEAEHDPVHGARMGYAYPWRGSSECPTWTSAIADWFGAASDQEVALEQWIGRALLTGAAGVRKALLLTGGAGRGKSTVLGTLAALWPSHGRTAVAPASLSHEYARADLAASHLNLIPEIPAKISGDAVAKIKQMVECDSLVHARMPAERHFSYVPSTVHIWAGNEVPEWRDPSGAIWDRVVHIRFTGARYRDAANERRDLRAALQAELPAIVRRCVHLAARSLAAGEPIPEPASSAQIRREEQRAACSVAEWLDDGPYVADDTGRVSAAVAYSAYSAYCLTSNRQPVSRPKFGRRLSGLGVSAVMLSRAEASGGSRRGYGLAERAEEAPLP